MVFALKVIAPASLDEGYSFDATVDGRTFRVKVPEGGVVAGQEFAVHDSQEIIAATNETSDQNDAPRGHWRKNIFSCIDTLFTETFWIAFLCPVIQTAQLQTRFNLNWRSAQDAPPETVRRTFVASMIVFLVFWTFIGWVPEAFILYLVFYFFIQTRLRKNARLRYDIPGNVVVDFFRTLFCSCCSTIQMVRQSHDEKEYPYDGCAVDGLPIWASPLHPEDTSLATEETPAEGPDLSPPPKDEITEITAQATVI